MQIILEENEIMEALNAYCAKNVIIPEGKKINVDFTVGRGGNGTRATIDFVEMTTPTNPAETSKELRESVNETKEQKTKKEPEAVSEPPVEYKEKTENPVAEDESTDPVTSGDSLFNM